MWWKFLQKKCFFVIIVLILQNYSSVYSIEYKIFQNEMSFDKQILKILSEINRIPKNESVVIRIEKGYYSINKTIQIKGGNHKIVLIGPDNKSAIISGSIEIKEWDMLPNGLWKTQNPIVLGNNYMPDQLFVNGVRATRSRTPNEGAFIIEEGYKDSQKYGARLKDEDAHFTSHLKDKEKPILTIFRKWTVSKRFLVNVDPIKKGLMFEGGDFPVYNPLSSGNGLIVENTINGIDSPGEWCVDKDGYIYYSPKDGEQIGKVEFKIPIIEKLFIIDAENGNGSFCFKNLVFEHTTYQVPKEGCEFGQAASHMSASIEIDNANNCSFEGCEIRNIANYGIWYRRQCLDSSIKRCYFHDLGAGAIKIGNITQIATDRVTNHIIVDNNIIHHYGVLMESAVGIILFNASDCNILHNDIHYGNYSEISIGWVWGYNQSPSKRNTVACNRISHIGSGLLNDIAGIYTLGKSEGTHIHHNVISDVMSSDILGWGIYADEGTSGVLFEKNVVYRTTSGGYHQHYGSGNIVTNNIFAWGKNSQFTLTKADDNNPLTFSRNILIMDSGQLMSGAGIKSKKFVIGNNCYWKISDGIPMVGDTDIKVWLQYRDSTSIYMNPLFRNPQNGDFRIKNVAVCKSIGFQEFNYRNAGVYGNKKWKKLGNRLDEPEN